MDDLAKRLLAGERRALARAISLVQDGDPAAAELVAAVYPHTGGAAVNGFTGPPGAGKSTLIAALVRRRREQGASVAVLAIDPSSPFSGGAVLGDRIRLGEHFLDEGVFIRSMASRGALGGLAEAALQTLLLIDASGRAEIELETVGVGQGEVDVAGHADTVVLVLVPGSGDSVQALKAGVMEIPDVIVVNKREHPMTNLFVREIRSVLALASPAATGGWKIPVVTAEAASGAGVEDLEEAIAAHREHLAASGALAERRARNLRAQVLELMVADHRRELERRLDGDPAFDAMIEEVAARRLDPASAARRLEG
jgi:LAO/AO transport system kinase